MDKSDNLQVIQQILYLQSDIYELKDKYEAFKRETLSKYTDLMNKINELEEQITDKDGNKKFMSFDENEILTNFDMELNGTVKRDNKYHHYYEYLKHDIKYDLDHEYYTTDETVLRYYPMLQSKQQKV